MRRSFSETRPLRALFAGLGHAGRRHLRNLVQSSPVNVSALRVRGFPLGNLQDLVAWESDSLTKLLAAKPDVVFVTNPTSIHLNVAVAAARAGCQLFVEKPLSDRVDGIGRLRIEVQRRDLICLVAYNARFRPTLRQARDWMLEGRIGAPLSARAQVGEWLPDWHPDEDYREGVSARRDLGGGVILDLSHELDYMNWLLGPVRRIGCFAGQISSLEIETEDVAEMILEFESGAIGSVHVDYLQREPSRTLQVIGEEGTIFWDALVPEARLLDHATGEWEVFRGEPGEREQSFKLEMEHFLACLRGEAELESDLDSGIEALRLAIAAKESAASGRIVELAEIVP